MGIGAYIGISGGETTGRVNVNFGDFSGTSEAYHQQPREPVEIGVVLASDEIWPDDPHITVAVQVRDSLLSTRFPGGETVSVVVSHSASGESVTGSSELDRESGVSLLTISLESNMTWFTENVETVNIEVTVSNSDGSGSAVATLMPVIPEDTISNLFMNLPAHTVFSGDEIDIPIYARYEYLLSSFSLNCSVGDHASIVGFTGPRTWSLLQTFPPSGTEHSSVTGFRNYDADNVTPTNFVADLLATLSVVVDSVSEMEESIRVECRAVDLLLTTKDSPDTNAANTIGREGLQDEYGLLFVEPVSVIKLFAHSSLNQVINIAVFTSEEQTLDLSVQAFYSDASLSTVTDNLQCNSENDNAIKVADNCTSVYFDGSESSSGQTKVMMQHSNVSLGDISFRVWLPTNTRIEVENDTLNMIESDCQEGTPMYQKTQLHVVTNLSEPLMEYPSVYITSIVLPYLQTDESILLINTTSGEIQGVGAGEAQISLLNAVPSTVTVSDSNPVRVAYLDAFIFSDIRVNLVRDTGLPTSVNIQLLQDFSYVSSKVKVVGVAIFDDGTRQVLDGSAVTVSPIANSSLDEMSDDQYVIIREVDFVGFDVQWVVNNCPIVSGRNSSQFSSFTPESIVVSASSPTIAEYMDPATLIGIQHTVELMVFLVYEDNTMVDVTLNSNINISFPENQLTISHGVIEAVGEAGTASIAVTYDDFLQSETSISVVQAEGLIVQAHPYPPYEGSELVNVNPVSRIGEAFQTVQIGVQLDLSNGAIYTLSHNMLRIETDDEVNLTDDILQIPEESDLGNVTIHVTLSSLSDELTLDIDASSQLVILNFTDLMFTRKVSMQNRHTIWFSVTFDGGIQQDNISNSDYPGLVEYYAEETNSALEITEDGSIVVLSNSPGLIDVCVRSKTDSTVHRCEAFSANLEPGIRDVDLGNPTGLPLEPVNVGTDVSVPVYLNLDSSPVGIFEMELFFTNGLVRFAELTQGSDWESGQIVYVDPGTNESHVSFGGILHSGVQGSQLHLANILFHSQSSGIASFSVNVSFISSNDIQTTPLVQNDAPQASEISIEIMGDSDLRKRDAYYEYSEDEETPLMPSPQARHGVRRHRRQANTAECEPNSVYGDANGDCVVDLRDVFLFQVYVAESVFDFSSPIGEEIYTAVDNGMLDGTFTLSDIQELEIIVLNLAYEARLNQSESRSYYDNEIDKCVIEISGVLEALSGHSPEADIKAHVIFGFSSVDPNFDNVFRNMTFMMTGVEISNQTYSVKMVVTDPPAMMDIRLDGQADSISAGFNVSVAVIVTDVEDDILSFSTTVEDLDEARMLLELEAFPPTDNSVLIDSCVQPSVSSALIATTAPIVSPTPSSQFTSIRATSSAVLVASSETLPVTTSMVFSSAVNTNSSTSQPSVSSGQTRLPTITSTNQLPSSAVSQVSSTETSSSMDERSSSVVPSISSSSLAPSRATSNAGPSTFSTTSVSVQPYTSRNSPLSRTGESSQISSLPSSTVGIPEISTVSSSANPSTNSMSTDEKPSITATLPGTAANPSTKLTSSMSTDEKSTTTATSSGADNTGSKPSASPTAAIVGATLGIVIAILAIIVGVCSGFVFVRRKKGGQYLFDLSNGAYVRRNSLVSNGSSFWRNTENGIVSSTYTYLSMSH